MKALIAEYAMHNDPTLAPEGKAMFDSVYGSFTRCGYDVVVPGNGDFREEIAKIAPECDVGLVIAPDHLMSRFTSAMESLTHNLGCGSMNAALCANKRRSGAILASHGIPVPRETGDGLHVIKPVHGCGSQGVRLTRDAAGPDEFSQEYIEGENLSVSVVGSRVVGEACLYFTGEPPACLAINRQSVSIDTTGKFQYGGGETPVEHPRGIEIIETATNAVKVLGCQGYAGVDVVVADKVYVVDVNPRITTSIVGISSCLEGEIAEILVKASKGEPVGKIRYHCQATFDAHGTVTGRTGTRSPRD